MSTSLPLADRFNRPLGVLRLSLTARCNLACPYCRPDVDDPPGLLTLEQQMRVIRVASRLGTQTLRLTGGEPLLSRRLLPLLEAVAQARRRRSDPVAGLEVVALTSNGVLLSEPMARSLRAAGLNRITISLDAAEGDAAARMAGLQGGAVAGERLVRKVQDGISAARAAGFDPSAGELKLNAVIQRGMNDDQLLPLAGLARQQGVELRLIEFMDVGNRNQWRLDQVLPAAQMVERIHVRWPLEPLGRPRGGTAQRWNYCDGAGSIGVIASISEPFCGDCNRLRVTADGQAFTCLFSAHGMDLKPVLSSEPCLEQAIRDLWQRRQDRYSEERDPEAGASTHAEMAYLGG